MVGNSDLIGEVKEVGLRDWVNGEVGMRVVWGEVKEVRKVKGRLLEGKGMVMCEIVKVDNLNFDLWLVVGLDGVSIGR